MKNDESINQKTLFLKSCIPPLQMEYKISKTLFNCNLCCGMIHIHWKNSTWLEVLFFYKNWLVCWGWFTQKALLVVLTGDLCVEGSVLVLRISLTILTYHLAFTIFFTILLNKFTVSCGHACILRLFQSFFNIFYRPRFWKDFCTLPVLTSQPSTIPIQIVVKCWSIF